MIIPPVIGYQGGKRRLLPRLRPYFDPCSISRYIEPFVGMGALYLDLRARGYVGPAVLSDSNPVVADFWRMAHDARGDELVLRAQCLDSRPKTPESFYVMVEEQVDDEVERVARFLWLTNFAFGNVPKLYEGTHWSRQGGTKLTSSEKWGKTFPWLDCVKRLKVVVGCLSEFSVEVVDDASIAIGESVCTDSIYADPPYAGQRGYKGAETVDYIKLLNESPSWVVLSESPDIASLLPLWEREDGEVVARTSGGNGATGKRSETIYVRRAVSSRVRIPADWLAVPA